MLTGGGNDVKHMHNVSYCEGSQVLNELLVQTTRYQVVLVDPQVTDDRNALITDLTSLNQ